MTKKSNKHEVAQQLYLDITKLIFNSRLPTFEIIPTLEFIKFKIIIDHLHATNMVMEKIHSDEKNKSTYR